MGTVHTCHVCGKHIQIGSALKPEEAAKASLDARADHYATHNPNPAQWTEAYNKMRAAKETKKAAE